MCDFHSLIFQLGLLQKLNCSLEPLLLLLAPWNLSRNDIFCHYALGLFLTELFWKETSARVPNKGYIRPVVAFDRFAGLGHRTNSKYIFCWTHAYRKTWGRTRAVSTPGRGKEVNAYQGCGLLHKAHKHPFQINTGTFKLAHVSLAGEEEMQLFLKKNCSRAYLMTVKTNSDRPVTFEPGLFFSPRWIK